MTKSKIEWLLPATPESLLMLDDPLEGLRPKWLAPGLTGDVLQIDALGRLVWGTPPPAPAILDWPLLAPDGVLAAPSYSFADAPGMGMFRNVGAGNKDSLTIVGVDGARLVLTAETDLTWGVTGFSCVDARDGLLYFGSWEQAPGDIRTALYIVSPSQNEQFSVHMIDGSRIVSLSVHSHLHLVAHQPVDPWAERRWILSGSDGSLAPATDNLYDLGAPATQIRDLYLAGQIYIDGVPLSPGGGGVTYPLLAPDGTTAAPSYSFASAPDVGLSAFDYGGDPTNKGLRFSVTPAYGLSAFEFIKYGAILADGRGTEIDLISGDGNTWSFLGLYEDLSGVEVYVGGGGGLFGLALFAGDAAWKLNVAGHFYPWVDNTQDLGDPTHQIRNLYISGGIYIDGVLQTPGGGGGSLTYPLLAPDGAVATPSYSFANSPTTGLYQNANNLLFAAAGVRMMSVGSAGTYIDSGLLAIRDLGGGSGGVTLQSHTDNILEQRNGTNPQTFHLYSTYTDPSNYERLRLFAGAGVADVVSESAGTGVARQLRLYTVGAADFHLGTNGTMRWFLSGTDGLFLASTDNVTDIGYPGAFGRPRSLYVGTSVGYASLASAPATPAAGLVVTYAKTDKKVYQKDDAGLETVLTGGGAVGVAVVPLSLDAARFPDGTANNYFPQPVERVSTTPAVQGWIPKPVTLVYYFDAVVIEHLLWKVTVPLSWAGGAVTLVAKWSMATATTGNMNVMAFTLPITDDVTDVRAVAFAEGMGASLQYAVPATLGRQREARVGPLPTTGYAAGRTLLVSLNLGAGATSSATGDRILEQAWLEFA